ncbi:hypothetical protein [Streptomyces sp. RKAG293]|uniref:hypothetical protein n=1 Tax=Streptomyces sp. RKAG293 TaxID=2893403 RepID=UPI0020333880|nr:hypothetical protein [Streptomyces sp. RKAG293]MCM2421473.1 hypothetical protein [Streptomyces sp. RKAG293]
MRAPTALTAAALATASALLLTACGGGGSDGKSDGIPGVVTTTATASATPSASATPTATGPDLTLPADLKLEFAWAAPSDHAKAVALADAAHFVQSIAHGVVKRNANDPGLTTYSRDAALAYGKFHVQNHLTHGWTLTGTDRYYRPQIRVAADGQTAEVAFCNDQTKMYGREVKTGKVLYTQPSDKDFSYYSIIMTKLPTSPELWQAKSIDVKGKATQCKQ